MSFVWPKIWSRTCARGIFLGHSRCHRIGARSFSGGPTTYLRQNVKSFTPPPPPSPESATSGPETVADPLLEMAFDAVVHQLPKDGSWAALTDIYATVPPEHRALIRREWKSLANFLTRYHHAEAMLSLNPTKTHVKFIQEDSETKVSAPPSNIESPLEPSFSASRLPLNQDVNNDNTPEPGYGQGTSSRAKKRRNKKKRAGQQKIEADAVAESGLHELDQSSLQDVVPEVTESYTQQSVPDVKVNDTNTTTSKIKLTAEGLTTKGAISLQQLAAFVPPFFVPVTQVLQAMPGYSFEHLERFAQETRVFELITLNLPPIPPGAIPRRRSADDETPEAEVVSDAISEKERCSFIRLHGGLSTRALCDINSVDGVNLRAASTYHSYVPPFSVAVDFAYLLAIGGRGQWRPLRDIVTNRQAVTAAAALQPLVGPTTLMYFAQLQHIFCFDPTGRGLDPDAGGAVSLPPAPPTRLTWHTSPAPIALHEIFRLIPPTIETTGVKAQTLVDNMCPEARAWLFACVWSEARCGMAAPYAGYITSRGIGGPPSIGGPPQSNAAASRWAGFVPQEPSGSSPAVPSGPYAVVDACTGGLKGMGVPPNCDLTALGDPRLETAIATSPGNGVPMNMTAALLRFVHWHSTLLGIKPHSEDIVMPAHLVDVERRQALPLREQLQMLLMRGRQAGNKKQIKRLRRRIVAEDQPDSPLLTSEGLAKAIHDLLPTTRAVTMIWLRNNLPPDHWHLIPASSRKFFVSHPNFFALWNVTGKERLFIARPSCPPPRNALKSHGFTQDELLWSIAKFLLTRNIPPIRTASAMMISNRIPIGIDNTIRKEYVGVAQFCQEFPQYFSVTIVNARNEQKLRASDITISLVALPQQVHIAEAAVGGVGEEALEAEGEDREEEEMHDEE